MISYIHANLLKNAIVELSHPQRRDIQGQETFSALSADKQTNVNVTMRHLKFRYISIFKNLITTENATKSVKAIYKFNNMQNILRIY